MDARLDLGRTACRPRRWDDVGESIVEQVVRGSGGAAVARWPMARIMLRQGARVVHDSGERLTH